MPASAPQPAATKNAGLFASAEKQAAIVALLLVVVTLAAYNPVASHPFVNYDDDRYVTANAHVRQGLTADTVRWALASTDQANWHPLTWISHAADFQLFRLNPAGHHLSSLLIHAANVALLFLVLVWGTRRVAPSALVALLFALHPINVESVAWVAERKNVLCAFFFLLALVAYGWYVKKPGWQRYLAVAAAFAAALASKPMAITLPFALLLVDYWPLGRIRDSRAPTRNGNIAQNSLVQLVVEKVPLLLLSAASAVLTIVAQQSGGAMRSTQQFSFAVRLANAIHAYALYLCKAVWPAKLAPMYPHPGDTLSVAGIVASASVLVIISAMVVALRRYHFLPAGWLFFLGTLVPVIGLIQVGDQAMADRYAYIPFIGLFVIFAFGADELCRRTSTDPATGTSYARNFAIPALTAGLLVVLSLLTRRQLAYWENNESLWRHTVAVTDRNFIAEDNLGGALLLQDRADEAFTHFEAAAAINPRDPMSRGNIGAYLLQQEKFGAAIDQLNMVPKLTNDRALRADAYANLGTAYRLSGDAARARESYDQSLRLNSQQPNAWLGEGILSAQSGDLPQAALAFERSAEIQPNPQTFVLLAETFGKLGQTAEARSAYENALRLQPGLPEAQKALTDLGSR